MCSCFGPPLAGEETGKTSGKTGEATCEILYTLFRALIPDNAAGSVSIPNRPVQSASVGLVTRTQLPRLTQALAVPSQYIPPPVDDESIWPPPEAATPRQSTWDRFSQKFKEEPFVPLGASYARSRSPARAADR